MLKLGLARAIDLALHLPLRYEDETRIQRLSEVREGQSAQVEGVVTSCEVKLGGHRQLLVTLDDGSDTCTLRFFTFYPTTQKALAVGNAVRVRGEIKGGFMGLQMMHPTFQPAGGDLAAALTPVYPTSAGLPQAYLRRAVDSGLSRAELSNTIPLEFKPNWPAAQVGPARGAHIFASSYTRCVTGHAGRPQPPGLAAAQSGGVAGAANLSATGQARARQAACAGAGGAGPVRRRRAFA